jgi:hypothetical protein
VPPPAGCSPIDWSLAPCGWALAVESLKARDLPGGTWRKPWSNPSQDLRGVEGQRKESAGHNNSLLHLPFFPSPPPYPGTRLLPGEEGRVRATTPLFPATYSSSPCPFSLY